MLQILCLLDLFLFSNDLIVLVFPSVGSFCFVQYICILLELLFCYTYWKIYHFCFCLETTFYDHHYGTFFFFASLFFCCPCYWRLVLSSHDIELIDVILCSFIFSLSIVVMCLSLIKNIFKTILFSFVTSIRLLLWMLDSFNDYLYQGHTNTSGFPP